MQNNKGNLLLVFLKKIQLFLGCGDLLLDSLLSFLLGQLDLSLVLLALGLNQSFLLVQELWLVDLLGGLDEDWISLDFIEDFGHQFLNRLGVVLLEALVPLGELLLESLVGFLLESLHVLVNVDSEDSVSVDLGVEGGLLAVLVLGESWELLD